MNKILIHLLLLNLFIGCESKQQQSVKAVLSNLEALSLDPEDQLIQIEMELKARDLPKGDLYSGDTTYFIRDTVVTLLDSTIRVNLRIDIPNQRIAFFQNIPTDTLKKAYKNLYQKSRRDDVVYRPRTIYGLENRREIFEELNEKRLSNANRVVGVFKSSRLELKDPKNYDLITNPFTAYNEVNLCEIEKFYNQPQGPFCTGFAITNKLILTAGHCFEDWSDQKIVDEVKFVFGFRYMSSSSINTVVGLEKVFAPKRVIQRFKNLNGLDLALVEVEGKMPFTDDKIVLASNVRKKDSLYVVGHPLGLPLKIAEKATIVNTDDTFYFIADLDTYGGNSGSPVFNLANELVGILIRGGVDMKFSYINNCYNSKFCRTIKPGECGGEKVLKISQFAHFLPNN